MNDFNEEDLNSLIEEALKQKGSSQTNPFASIHVGHGESDLLSIISKKAFDYLPESSVVSLMQDVRSELVARKSNYTLKDLHTVVKNCRKCNFSTKPELPKWNVKDPEVAIIIESPSIDPDSINYLIDKIKLAGFNSTQLCLTYVNRCSKFGKYENQEVLNCSSYIHSELQLLSPKVIVPMGALACSVLFGTDIKIKEYRGNLVWLGYWPVMPMYSPSYAMRTDSMSEQFSFDLSSVYKYINNI